MFGWKNYKMSSTKVVLLACGSYNPVTIMHLRMFEIARDALNKTGRFQVVGGYVSPVNDNYKKKDLLSSKHRIAMLKAALKTSDWIKLDTWESEQSSWLETIKVLRHIKQTVDSQHGVGSNVKPSPNKRRRKQQEDSEDSEDVVDDDASVSDLTQNKMPKIDVEEDQVPMVKLLCGADLLESFAVPGLWKDEDIEQIVGEYGLVVINREGSNAAKFVYESDILTKYKENILLVTEWLHNDISSTKIRRACRRGESIKYVVQDSVVDYIKEHRLYGFPDNKYINHMMPSPNGDVKSNEEEESTSSGEISVVLRSSQSGGYSGKHVPAQRMSMTLSPKRHGDNDNARVQCMSDFGTLVRRMKNVRLGFTPETCV